MDWKSEVMLPNILEKWGNFNQFYFKFFSLDLFSLKCVCYICVSGNGKNTEKVREICQSENVETMKHTQNQATMTRILKFMGIFLFVVYKTS